MRFFGGGNGDGKQSKRKKSVDDGLFPEITATKRRRSKRESDGQSGMSVQGDEKLSLKRSLQKHNILPMAKLVN